MSTSVRDKVIAYAGQGIAPAVIATACGVTPAYISQLLDLEDVKSEISQVRAGKLEDAIAADTAVETVEKAALAQIKAKLPFVKDAVSAARIFTALNNAKKKATPNEQNMDAVSAQQVTVTIPRGAALHFKINEVNQVIEVEGRIMAPLPSRSLADLQKRVSQSKLGVSDAAVLEVGQIQVPVLTSLAVAHRERQQAADTNRATNILRDLTMHIDGVEVVL